MWKCWFGCLGTLLACWLGMPDQEQLLFSPLAHAQAGQAGEGRLKFELYEDAAREHRWRLKAANGKTLATGGQGYQAKADAKSAVARLIKDVSKHKFEVYQDKAKEFRWRLKAANGQTVAASSEGYADRPAAEAAIALIKKGLPKAQVE
jgi:uncharacterized protein YegP (UPF0339 family)